MTRLRWYLDEDAMARGPVRGLRAREIDVLTAFEAEMVGEADEAQLDYAAREGRSLFTLNLVDFCRLHADWLAAGRSQAGIVVVSRQRYTLGEQIRGMAALTAEASAEDLVGSLVFLKV